MHDVSIPPPHGARAPLVLHLARMEMAAFLRNPLALFWTFAYPLILFFLMNAIFGGRPAAVAGGLSYSDYLITGIVTLTWFTTALFSFALPLVELRARSRLKPFAHMPLPPSSFFLGFTAARLLVLAAFSAIFMLALSHLSANGSALSPGRTLELTAFLAAGGLVLVGIGIALAAGIKHTSTAHAITNIANVPVIFLSDLFLPVALFPAWLQAVAHASPLYAFVEGLREVYAGAMPAGSYLAWIGTMTVTGVVLVCLAARSFSWTPAPPA